MTVTTRRERRQQQRRQQQRRTSSSGGGGGGSRGINQMWIALAVAIGIVALILVGRAAGVFTPAAGSQTNVQNVDTSGPKIGTHQENIGNAHIPTGQKGNYTEGLPPTSGEHYASPAGPAPWGVKTSWLPFEVTTHNLEHGGIVIMYANLTQAESEQLQGLVRNLMANGNPKIILEPWPDMKDSKVILTAWDWILKQQSVDDTTIVKFVKQHTDDEAPENGTP